jgi:inorganic pyrophosphatase
MFNLWLDDVRDPENFIAVRKWYTDNDNLKWVWVKTVQEAIDALKTNQVAIASLDHDLGFLSPDGKTMLDLESWIEIPEDEIATRKIETGKEVIMFLIEQAIEGNNYWPVEGTYVHSANPVGKKWMQEMIANYGPYNK